MGPVKGQGKIPNRFVLLTIIPTFEFQINMDGLEFRKHGRDMVDYIVDYLDNIDSRRVTPNTEPGYLQNLIPSEPPNEPEEWDTIMDDVEKKIMIGVMTTLINIYMQSPLIRTTAK